MHHLTALCNDHYYKTSIIFSEMKSRERVLPFYCKHPSFHWSVQLPYFLVHLCNFEFLNSALVAQTLQVSGCQSHPKAFISINLLEYSNIGSARSCYTKNSYEIICKSLWINSRGFLAILHHNFIKMSSQIFQNYENIKVRKKLGWHVLNVAYHTMFS